ncbi:hypothetical protein CY658_31930 [Variovorax sp. RO1]|uniref:hypothetical protein n=1 Tax=Variovorax sp. RO1 TaxID=2066034 RepID=UPI000CC65936|nr:hypothetical protein [Variovorax sp. RO1]PLC01534.1 hypothetical protein CY658_31930 [Variovorax sp. RO1]
MRSTPTAIPAPGVASQKEVFPLNEEFFQRVDRVMLQRKQTDPFQQDVAWRATEEEARLRQLQLLDDAPVRTTLR